MWTIHVLSYSIGLPGLKILERYAFFKNSRHGIEQFLNVLSIIDGYKQGLTQKSSRVNEIFERSLSTKKPLRSAKLYMLLYFRMGEKSIFIFSF